MPNEVFLQKMLLGTVLGFKYLQKEDDGTFTME